MKKSFFIFFLLFCLAGVYAQTSSYGTFDLVNYLVGYPNSSLPEEGTEIWLSSSALSIVSANIDGDGVDYLAVYAGSSVMSSPSKYICIYAENIKTGRSSFYNLSGKLVYETTISSPITIIYTGKKVPAISKSGNRIEVPLFIEKGL